VIELKLTAAQVARLVESLEDTCEAAPDDAHAEALLSSVLGQCPGIVVDLAASLH
jgi:hypothetical protein